MLEKAHHVLRPLCEQRLANSQTYAAVMAMHAQVGDTAGVARLLAEMKARGVHADAMTYQVRVWGHVRI